MFLVVSYSADIFYDDDIKCQFEFSFKLSTLIDKYGDPTQNHNHIDFEPGAEIFDLNYFQISEGEFNLCDTYLTPQKVKEIVNAEKEAEKSDDESNGHDSKNSTASKLDDIIKDVNIYRKKIYDISPQNSEIPVPTDIVLPENMDDKMYKRKFKQFSKMKRGLIGRYKSMIETGQYYYVTLHFDKDTIPEFDKSDDVKNVTINGDQLFYGRTGKKEWTSIEYELFYNMKAHFKVHEQSDQLLDYIDETIGQNKNKYDNANIFFSKFNMNKEFDFLLKPITEVWLATSAHKTVTSPARLTHNRFYTENVKYVSEEKLEEHVKQIYRTYSPVAEYGHTIQIEHIVPLDKMNDTIKYYNEINAEECTIAQILKAGFKSNVIHERLTE